MKKIAVSLMKMRKIKIIVVNIILFFILFHIVDFFCSIIYPQYEGYYKNSSEKKLVKYVKDYNLIHRYNIKFDKKLANNSILTNKYSNIQDISPKWGIFRPIENKNARNSILIFGCSYAYGNGLNNQETFSHKLGKCLPNYTIYNRAQSGWSTSHMLYQLENNNFSDIKNIKYVIYIFISSHFIRNYNSHLLPLTPYYKFDENGKLTFEQYTTKNISCPILLYKRGIFKTKLQHVINSKKKNTKYKRDVINLTKNIILSSKEILDDKYNRPKFIILRYDKDKETSYNKMFEELEKEGITVLHVNDLSNKNYRTLYYQISNENMHPNERAWNEITPLFVKYLQSKGYFKD